MWCKDSFILHRPSGLDSSGLDSGDRLDSGDGLGSEDGLDSGLDSGDRLDSGDGLDSGGFCHVPTVKPSGSWFA